MRASAHPGLRVLHHRVQPLGALRGQALFERGYSLGLGVPFAATGVFLGRLRGTLRFLNMHALALNRVAGTLLIVMGLLMVTGQLAAVGVLVLRLLPTTVG